MRLVFIWTLFFSLSAQAWNFKHLAGVWTMEGSYYCSKGQAIQGKLFASQVTSSRMSILGDSLIVGFLYEGMPFSMEYLMVPTRTGEIYALEPGAMVVSDGRPPLVLKLLPDGKILMDRRDEDGSSCGKERIHAVMKRESFY